MSKFITTPLAKDLPENWNDTQYVSPNGTEVGLSQKHGYNYLMKQVNNAQKAAEELGAGMDYMVGVNLLDNWYFVDPVHRKLEKYAVKGASYYGDSTFGQVVDTLDSAVPVLSVTDAYGTIKIYGYTKTFYVKVADIRDGYAAAESEMTDTIDRWKGHQSFVHRAPNGITLTTNGSLSSQSAFMYQYFVAPQRLAGKQVTVSVLVNSMSKSGYYIRVCLQSAISRTFTKNVLSKQISAGLNSFTFQMDTTTGSSSYPYACVLIEGVPNESIEIAAIKMELGPYQTLAHQDSTGAWVLNEIPNKGLETVKCNCAPVELGGIGKIVSPEDIGLAGASTLADAEVV